MRVLIIPEDPTLDQHVLMPVVALIFEDLGRPARIDILRDPHLSGISQALDQDTIGGVVLDYPMIDLFLLVVDRDCDRFSNEAKAAARQADHPRRLIASLAWQELEVWALAPHRETLRAQMGAAWGDVRASCDPKEAYYDPFIAKQGWAGEVGRGRKRAMRDLGASWRGIQKVCPEIQVLKAQIQAWLAGRSA